MTGSISPAVSTLPRPAKLKGLHLDAIKRNLGVAIGLSIISVIAYKFAINEPKKQRYAEFYKNYDPNVAFERMKKHGVFQSVKE